MKKSLILFLAIGILSCNVDQSNENDLNVDKDDTVVQYEVEYYGALKNFMHKGDVSAKVDLNEFSEKEHYYAIGASENLKGEVLIYNGRPYISSVKENQIAIDQSFNSKAALFVGAQVVEWSELEIDPTVKTYEQLEEFIKSSAETGKIDMSKPFPFLISGKVDSLDWHVIDWPEGDTVHTHQKHVESGLNGRLKFVEVDILGFYSDSHHAIFTHHSTNMHLHFLGKGEEIAGHVDDLFLGSGMILKLPYKTD